MDPSGQNSKDGDGQQSSGDGDRKPPARRSSTAAPPAARFQQPSQVHQQQPSLPAVAPNESSSSAELMRRLVSAIQNNGNSSDVATAVGQSAASLQGQTQPQQPQASTDSSLESQILQRLGLSQSPGVSEPPRSAVARLPSTANSTANSTTASNNSSSVEFQLACLQAQTLLRQQEDSLRNTRLLLQRFSDASSLTSSTAGEAGAGARGQSATDSASELLIWRRLLDNDNSNELGGSSGTAAAASASAQPLARSTSQDSAAMEEVDQHAHDNSQPDSADFCQDEDDLNDDDYFKDFDTEDSHKLNNETFPFRLYRMLYEVETNGQADVASFASKGQVFLVHRPKRFVEEIMPKYFSTSRLASFQRQLNLYGFQRINEGGLRGGYYHQHFQKGKRALCRKIKRQRTRVKAAAAANANPAAASAGGAMQVSQSLPSMQVSLPLQPAGATIASLGGSFGNLAAAAAVQQQQQHQQQQLHQQHQQHQQRADSEARASDFLRHAASVELSRLLESRRNDRSLQGLLDGAALMGSARPPAPALGSTSSLGFAAPAPSLFASLPSSTLRSSFTAAAVINNNTATNSNSVEGDLLQALVSQALANRRQQQQQQQQQQQGPSNPPGQEDDRP
ncbi:shock factor protein 4 [Seminavis robusta]|uniref:Shock factor protein 4 n=1 Tax=Seminavis robusta TaxID=568900 RepID=A0A9N8EML4_9STRA|nr:shock factor protein 4 [Seminavis robusta]|eukprot:Sro1223_g253930.1 shock factor protein 4 (623) ;mRNA; r:25676-27737